MVYVDPKNLGYEPYWQKWVNDRPASEQDTLRRMYDKYVISLIDMICEGVLDGKQGDKMSLIVPLTNLNLVSFTYYFGLKLFTFLILVEHYSVIVIFDLLQPYSFRKEIFF